jgi:nitrogen-specific signal transduction histidine kinase
MHTGARGHQCHIWGYQPNDHEEPFITPENKSSCGSDAFVATKDNGASRDVGVAPTKCVDDFHGKLAEHRRLHISTLWNGEAVQVSIRDQGRGIAIDDMERIFEPFFTTKPQGMGLGLAICRNIITAHNGQLWASNNADRGASFYFTLPVYPGESA